MKVVAVLGSPRVLGNSTWMAHQLLDHLRRGGAHVKEFYLNGLTYRGCQGCGACKGALDTCVLDDDLTPLLADVQAAEVTVFATPVYFGDVSGQFKLFFDRTYSYLDADYASRLTAGKRAVFVVSQGAPEPEAHADVIPRYVQWLTQYGFAPCETIRATGVHATEAASARPELAEEIAAVAARLLAG